MCKMPCDMQYCYDNLGGMQYCDDNFGGTQYRDDNFGGMQYCDDNFNQIPISSREIFRRGTQIRDNLWEREHKCN